MTKNDRIDKNVVFWGVPEGVRRGVFGPTYVQDGFPVNFQSGYLCTTFCRKVGVCVKKVKK